MTQTVTDALRAAAAQLLESGTVAIVIGYGREPGAGSATPLFARTPEQAAALVFDDTCAANLAVYAAKPEVRALGRIGLVVKGCDLRAVNVLLREHVVKREDVYLIGAACTKLAAPAPEKCAACTSRNAAGCDMLIGEAEDASPASATPMPRVADLEAKSMEDRWAFWRAQFDKCIRCYACRQVCPLCYCKRCVVEKNTPQWIDTSAHLRGNTSWNIVRAFHLTGRCVGCGECERACPVGIPLGMLNRKMSALIHEWFDFESGVSPDDRAPFTVWSAEDTDHGIL